MEDKKVQVTEDLSLSRIIQGHWRLDQWYLDAQELLNMIKQEIEMGVTSFDHADIYGDYSCEELMGKAIKADPTVRKNIELITKCGIKLKSHKFPERSIKYYDLSFEHIVKSAESSLLKLNTDYIDVLLLHRPAPLYDPSDVARAFNHLYESGKVRSFGVSNFTPQQFKTLDAFVDQPLVINQIEVSPSCHEHFQNGNIDFCLEQGICPMAWSPLAGGELFNSENEKSKRILATLTMLSEKYEVSIDTIAISWVLQHPVGLLPIMGTGKLERIQSAVHALDIKLTQEEWYLIYISSQGNDLP